MVMLSEQYDYVIGGDPDRDTIDLAAIDTGTGQVAAHVVDSADGPGYAPMLTWADAHAPGSRVWALEGTGSFAAGLAVFLAEAGQDVVEVAAGKRTSGAKNDRIDAVRAARHAMACERRTTPRQRGLREALHMVLTTRHAVLVSHTKAINELKSLIVVAPEHLRAGLRQRSLVKQLAAIDELQAAAGASTEHRTTVFTLRSIAARIRFLSEQISEFDRELSLLLQQHPAGPTPLAEPGVRPVVAAQLLVSWSHSGRVRSEAAFASLAGAAPLEASSGQRVRHRLSRSGERNLNRALQPLQ